MRHAIHSEFKSELIKFSNTFTFKTCPYNDNYIEINTWPSSMSAKEAKDFLTYKGIPVINLDSDGTEFKGELLPC